jgi:alpha-L-fucosidase
VIIVNRGGGIFEDYLTPEQGGIPSVPYIKPWEVCMTMATQWAYKKNDVYKSMPTLINLLLSVVSSGGNLLLDIGPDAQGQFPADAQDRLNEFAKWMNYNSEGIYNTVPIYPYRFVSTIDTTTNHLYYLTRKDRNVYAYLLVADTIPNKVFMPFVTPKSIGDVPFNLGSVRILPFNKSLPFRFETDYLVVDIPPMDIPYKYTLTFKFSEH